MNESLKQNVIFFHLLKFRVLFFLFSQQLWSSSVDLFIFCLVVLWIFSLLLREDRHQSHVCVFMMSSAYFELWLKITKVIHLWNLLFLFIYFFYFAASLSAHPLTQTQAVKQSRVDLVIKFVTRKQISRNTEVIVWSRLSSSHVCFSRWNADAPVVPNVIHNFSSVHTKSPDWITSTVWTVAFCHEWKVFIWTFCEDGRLHFGFFHYHVESDAIRPERRSWPDGTEKIFAVVVLNKS